MPSRRPSKISNAFRKLKLRKQLAKTRLAEAKPAEEERPARPRLRLVTDADAARDEDTEDDS